MLTHHWSRTWVSEKYGLYEIMFLAGLDALPFHYIPFQMDVPLQVSVLVVFLYLKTRSPETITQEVSVQILENGSPIYLYFDYMLYK